MAENQPGFIEHGVHSSHSVAIGVDLGATKIAAALVQRDGQILASTQVPTQVLPTSALLDQIASLINDLLDSAPTPVDGIGIGSPGLVNSERGIVRAAINLKWEEVALRAEISRRISQPISIWIQKDANASTLGEYYYGAARNCQDFFYLGIGSGFGAGVFTSGCLVVGADWAAADLGHLSLDPQGILCACGQRGCTETILSGPGLVALVEHMVSTRHSTTALDEAGPLTPAVILQAAREGDTVGQAAFNQLGHLLGVVLASCVALLNPRRAVIGGGLGLAAFDLLVPSAWEELRRRILPENIGNLEIVPSGQPSSAAGAASLVWYYQGLAFSPGGGENIRD